ncbi:MAG: patatin-like phospholipase family protein, partial [Actinobacteria bacterium]|nr:patatin-like phospholipase family protein [Actinomycetota bacterium]
AFHAGVVGALAEAAGWDARQADVIVGTSAGSITATSLRVGISPIDLLHRQVGEPVSPKSAQILARAKGGAREFPRTQGIFRPAAPDLLRMFARSPGLAKPGKLAAAALPEGRVSTEGIAQSMSALCLGRWPQPAPWITALRLTDGERVVFGRDVAASGSIPVGSAVAASCAIPGYFAPVAIDGARYVDGGAASACNADVLVDGEVDAVIISAPMAIHSGPRWAVDTPVRRVLRRQVDKEIASLKAAGKQVFLFAPTEQDAAAMGANPMGLGKEAAVARSAHASASSRIRADGRLRSLQL